MAYIGRDTDKISNVEVLDNITFDGSSSYTLQKGGSNFTPSSANTLLVSIDGVVQAGNFTVSGSTIDFGTAVAGTSTCDFILHYGVGLITIPADGTVTSAKLSYPLTTFSSTGIDDNADATTITIDSNENVGIGTASPTNFGAGFKTLEIKNSGGDASELITGNSVIAQTIASNTNSLVYMGSRSDHELIITTNDTERMRIRSSGLAIGGTGDANTLSDYEEGTWTPSLNVGTKTVNSANYVKIGRLVMLNFVLSNFSDTTSNTTIEITGIPFNQVSGTFIGSAAGERTDVNTPVILLYNNYMRFNNGFGVSDYATDLKYSDINNGSDFDIIGTITYFTDS